VVAHYHLPQRSTMKLASLSITTVRGTRSLVSQFAPDVTSYRHEKYDSVGVPLRAAI